MSLLKSDPCQGEVSAETFAYLYLDNEVQPEALEL